MKKFFVGAAIGSAISAVTVLLFAPQSGKKTRRDIVDKSEEMVYEAKKFCKNGKKQISRTAEEAKEKAEEVLEKVKENIKK